MFSDYFATKRPHIGELERNEVAGGSSFASSSVKYSFMSSSAPSVLLACSDELAVREGHGAGAGNDDDHDDDDDEQHKQHRIKSTSTHFFYEVKTEAFNSHANLNDIVVVHRTGLLGGNAAADRQTTTTTTTATAGSESAVVEADVAAPAAVVVNTEQQQQQEHKSQEAAEELELEELAREVHYLKEMISSDEKKSSNDDDDDNDNDNDNSCSGLITKTAAMSAVAADDDELNQALVANNVIGTKIYFDLLLGCERLSSNNNNNIIGNVSGHVKSSNNNKQARTSSMRTACDEQHMYAKQLINEEQLKQAFIKNV